MSSHLRLSGWLVAVFCLLPCEKTTLAQPSNSPNAKHITQDAGMPVTDSLLQDPCGPVSCYVALKSLNKLGDRDFRSIASGLEWDNGRPVEFTKIYDYLKSTSGIDAKLIRTTPSQLKEIMADGNSAMILATRRNSSELNHAVCLTGVGDDRFDFVEYPSLNYSVSEADLVKDWDGEAIVVTRSSWNKLGLVAVALIIAMSYFWIRR